MPQTTILDRMAVGYPGQLVDCGFRDVISRKAETAMSEGQPALRGTDPDSQVTAVTDGASVTGATFMGFVTREHTRPFSATDEYPAGYAVGVLTEGRMFVRLTGNATAGQNVYIGNATAQLGDIQGTTGTGLTLATNCRFLESGTSGDVVTIQIDRS